MALLALLLACWPAAAQDPTRVLRDARVERTVGAAPPELHDVSLPYHWDRLHPGRAGTAVFELRFPFDHPSNETHALYLPWIGNAYAVWLNGHLLQQKGDLQKGNGPNFAKAPRWVEIPRALLQPDNLIRIQIRADMGRRGGLGEMTLGPESMIRPLYNDDHAWRITGSNVVVIANLLVALIALALWLTQVERTADGRSQRDPLYLYAGLAELSWSLRLADTLVENPPVSWPWWGMLTELAMTVWVCSLMMFCIELAAWRDWAGVRWLKRWVGMLVAGAVAAAYGAMQLGHPAMLTVLYAALGVTVAGFLVSFVLGTRLATLRQKAIAFVLMINIAVGLRDLVVFRISEGYGGDTLLRYSSLLFGLALGYMVLARLRDATTQARDLLANMEQHVRRKEQELQQIYPRLEKLAREQERSAERSRVLRDMHDGVGSHISTAIRQLQSGRASHADILHTLRDSLDHLKLSIDAIHVPPGDVGALLANIRYRLESRIQACGVELQWDVEELQPLARLDSNAMGQLQFMVYEAFSNVLQHAQATMMRVAANPIDDTGAGLHLQIIDNGTGYDTQAPYRNGLRSMQHRALLIGVTLRLASEPGRSVVEITAS